MISVALGGAVGAATRYLLSEYVNSTMKSQIPLAILVINVLGAFILGIIVQFSSVNLLLLLATGFCGGFTTYSTFSIEAIHLLQSKKYILFALHLLFNIFGSVLGVLVGQWITLMTI